MTISKPMLAGTCKDISRLRYPVIASPKLDGIRCLKIAGRVVSRKFKEIPNQHIRTTLEWLLPDGIDGEILSGDTFQRCTSAVMSRGGKPDFVFWAFDLVSGGLDRPFRQRIVDTTKAIKLIGDKAVSVVSHGWMRDPEQLEKFEALCLRRGYEGVMLRDPEGPYKCGRSTEKQGWLLKLKRFVDNEAVVLGFEERMHNKNELQRDELGYAKRSTAKAGKVGSDTLGRFLVRDLKTGVEFKIGTGLGLDDRLRQEIWDSQESFLGSVIKYKCQPYGTKDKPRLPIFLGFRHQADM